MCDGLLHTWNNLSLLCTGHTAVLRVSSLMSAIDRNGTGEPHSRIPGWEEVEYEAPNRQALGRILALPLTSGDLGQVT